MSLQGSLLLCPLVEELWEPWAKCPPWEEGPNIFPCGATLCSPSTCHGPSSVDIRRHSQVEESSLAWPLCSFPTCLQPALPATHLTIAPPGHPAPGTIHCPQSHHRLLASPLHPVPPPSSPTTALADALLSAWNALACWVFLYISFFKIQQESPPLGSPPQIIQSFSSAFRTLFCQFCYNFYQVHYYWLCLPTALGPMGP